MHYKLLLLIILFAKSFAINSADINYDDLNDSEKVSLMQKIRSEYKAALANFKSDLDYIQITTDNMPELFNLIMHIYFKMDVKKFCFLYIFKSCNESGEEINAFSNSIDKNLIIGNKLLSLLSYDEFVRVIGHEYAHVKLNHSERIIKYRQKVVIVNFLAVLFLFKKYLYHNVPVPLMDTFKFSTSLVFLGLAYKMIINSMMHDLEYEADKEAVNFFGKKEYLISAILKAEKELTENRPKLIEDHYVFKKFKNFRSYFQKHPLTEDRDKALRVKYV